MASQESLNEKLRNASLVNELYTVKVLLELGADPHTSLDELSLLHHAASLDTLELLKLLIEEGNVQDINFSKNTDVTLLMHACRYGRVENAKYLLKRGADVTQRNKDGRDVIHLALQVGKPDMLKECLTWKGVDINSVDHKGNTALLLACQFEKLPMVEVLVAAGADVNITNEKGESVVTFAVRDEKIKKILLGNNLLTNKTKNVLSLWGIVLDEFPQMPNSEIQMVISAIEDSGVDLNSEDLKDIRHLDATDFKGVIPPIRARKFIQALWEKFIAKQTWEE